MENGRVQYTFSLILIIGYLVLLLLIIGIEIFDPITIKEGEVSLLGELKILIGVLTAAVAQVINFWFDKSKKSQSTPDPETNP